MLATMRAFRRFALCVLLLATPLRAAVAHAQQPLRQLPRSLVVEMLAEPQPTAFAPGDFSTEDFTIERLGEGDASIEASLEAGSLEWARIARYLVLPRAVLLVRAKGAATGLVSYARSSQPMAAADGSAHAEVPIALIAGSQYPVHVQVRRDGVLRSASFVLRFSPRKSQRAQVLVDSSCSPYGVHVRRGAIPDDSWMYIGCSAVITSRGDHDSATLELYVLWEQAGAITIEGVGATPVVDTLFTHQLAASPGATTFAASGKRVELVYRLPEPLHAGFLGMGFGPYYYRLQDDRATRTECVPLLTLYAGYSVNPTMRVVYFNATAVDRAGFIDQGIYLWLEQLRAIDDRLSMNLLLGANVLIYSRHDQPLGRLSAPQGFELVFRDFLGRNRNLTAGAFLYPQIADRSYYNVWLRWGSGKFFGEINYIAWQEPHSGGATKSQSFGLSFGIPVARFMRSL
ncbi:MAG TPA: hypothetical protein VF331_05120 [Polyangiales bacterium]